MSSIDDAVTKYPDRYRHCPMCSSDDVDFGIDRHSTSGTNTKVICNACQYTETGSDADSLFLKWTVPSVIRKRDLAGETS